MKIYKFRDCVLNTVERRVVKNGKFLDLTPKTFDILQLLVEKRGEIATKDEILGKVWNGSIVEEGNLPVHIRKLRSLLGETESERFIETAPGSGYRFVAPIESANGHRDPNGDTTRYNTESHKHYLKGKYLFDKRTVDTIYRAIDCYQESLEFDPNNIHSLAELGECYLSLYILDQLAHAETIAKLEPVLRRISQLDKHVDSVEALLGGIELLVHWNFDKAKQHFETALSTNPNCLVAHVRLVELLCFAGDYARAFDDITKVSKVDPLSILTCRRIGRFYWKMGLYDQALRYFKDALDLEPSDYESLILVAATLVELGRDREAMDALREAIRIEPSGESLAMIGYAHAKAGRKTEAYKVIDEIMLDFSKISGAPMRMARIYAALGDKESAFACLEKAFQEHSIDLLGLPYDPRLATIRNEERFEELLRKVGVYNANNTVGK